MVMHHAGGIFSDLLTEFPNCQRIIDIILKKLQEQLLRLMQFFHECKVRISYEQLLSIFQLFYFLSGLLLHLLIKTNKPCQNLYSLKEAISSITSISKPITAKKCCTARATLVSNLVSMVSLP